MTLILRYKCFVYRGEESSILYMGYVVVVIIYPLSVT